MKYKIQMVEGGLFKRFSNAKPKAKIKGNSFLVNLDKDKAEYIRKVAESEGKTGNEYASELLNKIAK